MVPREQLGTRQNQRDPAARRGEYKLTLLSQSSVVLAYPLHTDIISFNGSIPALLLLLSVN
jgi:hypothetical protein